MHKFLLSVAVLGGVMSAHAVLPTPSEEVSYSAKTKHTAVSNSSAISSPPVSFGMPNTAPTTVPLMTTAPEQKALPTLPLSPNQNQAVRSVVNAFVVRQIDGQETLIPVNLNTSIKSGDVLEYQGLFTNQGDRVRRMNVAMSIPDGLEFLGVVSPEFAHASPDGSRFVRMPIRVRVNGQIQELPLSQYKALRWTVEDVGIGGTAVVKYRAKVR